MQQKQNGKNEEAPEDCTLKKDLANSGFSEDVTEKIWKWYHPSEKHK